jgi:hypothetical protein
MFVGGLCCKARRNTRSSEDLDVHQNCCENLEALSDSTLNFYA